MILELILIVAILGIFVIIVRRLPEALSEGKTTPSAAPIETTKAPSAQPVGQALNGLKDFWAKISPIDAKKTSTALVAPAPTTTTLTTSSEITEATLVAEGDTYMEQGKIKEAERCYLRAVSKSPKEPKLYNRLGANYLKARNYSDALQAFEAARDLDGSKASRHYNVALAAWQLGNLGKARDAIKQAMTLDASAQKYKDLSAQIENGTA